MKKFRVFIIVELFLTLADMLLTFYNTPDLLKEGNPLVYKLGLGWPALIFINILFFLFFCVMAYYAFVVYKTRIYNVKNIREYMSQLLHGRPDKFWSLFTLPKDWSSIFACSSISICIGSIASHLVVVTEWIATTFHFDLNAYSSFVNMLPFKSLFLCLGTITILITFVVWFCIEYNKSKKAMNDVNVVFSDSQKGKLEKFYLRLISLILCIIIIICTLILTFSYIIPIPKTINNDKYSITLTRAFREKTTTDVNENSLVYFSEDAVVILEYALKEQLPKDKICFKNAKAYAFHMSSHDNNVEVFDGNGYVYYETIKLNNSNKEIYCYVCVFESNDAFLYVEFKCMKNDFEKLKKDFVKWGDSISLIEN